MSFLKWTITHIAPLFIVTSPVTSYADQIWSMSKARSSSGFSLDIPLIMLVSSILKYVNLGSWEGDGASRPIPNVPLPQVDP